MDVKKESISEENENKTLSTQSSTLDHFDIDLNGLLIRDIHIPEEVLSEIFCYVHHKQLLMCHLVCKQWEFLIKKYVWRKKAERISNQILHFDDNVPWISYYFICDKKPFNRNLLLSKKSEVRMGENIRIIEFDSSDVSPSINVLPFPEDPAFEGKISCVKVDGCRYTYEGNIRKIVIDLLKEGFTEHVLDHIQPTIQISEWYCCSWKQENANFKCTIKLLNGQKRNRIIRTFYFDKRLKTIDQKGHWIKFTYEFKKYGKGLRKIKFYDEGTYQVMMAGACIKLVPEFHPCDNDDSSSK